MYKRRAELSYFLFYFVYVLLPIDDSPWIQMALNSCASAVLTSAIDKRMPGAFAEFLELQLSFLPQ